MKKILFGFLGIALIATVVSASAYALFSATATVSGINLTAGNAAIEIGDVNGGSLTTNWNFNGSLLSDKLYPGYTNHADFTLKNSSSANISLKPNIRLTSAGGDWGTLSGVISLKVQDLDHGGVTGYYTLAQWNQANGINLNTGAITQGEVRHFRVFINVPSSATNSIADKALTNVTFVVTGTQQ